MPPEIITQADARAAGRNRYFTGVACVNGHIAERYCNGKNCVECTGVKSNRPGRPPKPKTTPRPMTMAERFTNNEKHRLERTRAAAKFAEQHGPPLRRVLTGLAASMEGQEAKERSDYLDRRLRERTGI